MFANKKKTSREATTYVGNGMKIEGKLRCSGAIRIDGEVHGDIDCQSEVTIGPSATIMATIHAERVIVNGRVEGSLFARDQLEVLAKGHIVGNVSNPPGKLIIHEGAVIEGQCFTYETPKKLISVNGKSNNKDSEKITVHDSKLLESSSHGSKEQGKKNLPIS